MYFAYRLHLFFELIVDGLEVFLLGPLSLVEVSFEVEGVAVVLELDEEVGVDVP